VVARHGQHLPWLWAISQPTLVVAGDDDPITPLINHRVIAMLMPRRRCAS
jgi:pimeloyl-ACP methyl ester carboxylesterase